MTTKTLHIWHSCLPFTLFVWGPYKDGTFDVEVWNDHIELDERRLVNDEDPYVGTVTIDRDTHIVADIWDWMDAHV